MWRKPSSYSDCSSASLCVKMTLHRELRSGASHELAGTQGAAEHKALCRTVRMSFRAARQVAWRPAGRYVALSITTEHTSVMLAQNKQRSTVSEHQRHAHVRLLRAKELLT